MVFEELIEKETTMDSKRELKIAFASILLSVGTICFMGCDESPQARYDAMTGEKLPEKVEHLKDTKFEQTWFDDDGFRLRVFRIEMEGHVYYTRACGESSFTHSAGCPCHTNNIERK